MFSLCWQLSEGSTIQPMKCTAMYACLMEFNETNKPFDLCHRVPNNRTGSSLSFSVFGCCMHRAVHSPFETEQPQLSNSGSGLLASELTFSLIQLAFRPCLVLLLFHRQGELMKPCFARMGKRRHQVNSPKHGEMGDPEKSKVIRPHWRLESPKSKWRRRKLCNNSLSPDK